MKKGIDVSRWQGDIDWKKVRAAGIEFAIIQAGYGRELSQKDEKFEQNYGDCKAAGMPCGVYWYSYARTEAEAEQEAAVCLEIIRGRQLEYPVFFDVEEPAVLRLGKAQVSKVVRAFLRKVEAAGWFVGLYMSAYQLRDYIEDDVKQRYTVWVAHYGVSKPDYSGSYGIWQKSSTGSVDGISGNVDLDECYTDYPARIMAKGLNGFQKQTAVPVKVKKQVTLIIDDKKYSGLLEEQ
ncbi:MAG: glycoside hydrolase family 25 protein [Ruminococcus sp.]|nr:glycoside hydrolase family 25 protein [Ruminococcus sp.]